MRSRPHNGLRDLAAIPVTLILLLATAGTAAAKPTPTTFIDSAPAAATTSTSATFTFHSNQSPATYSCRLDSSSFVPCTSPTSYSGLTAGSHRFTVYATVNGVSDSSPPVANWTIDLTPPSAPANLSGSAQSPTSVNLSWTAGVDNVGVTANLIARNGTPLATVGAVTSYTDSTATAATTYTYTVRAKDAAGNSSPASNVATVSTPPTPDTLIDGGPAAVTPSTGATFTFHSTVSGATFTCRLDTAKANPCTSPRAYTALGGGSHTFSVYATAGGVSDPSPATATWTVDLVAPSAPTGLVASKGPTSLTLNWTPSADNTGVVAYEIYRDGALLSTVGNVTVHVDSTVAMGVTYSYTVRARDGAGNLSAMSSSVAARLQATFDSHLTRAPYLTDLVNLHVAVNFATDQSATTASVAYGPVGTGGCTLTTTVPASRITILVGTVYEYQWKGDITLPAAGTYCYRVYLGATDLLAGNATPAFTTQVQFGSTEPFSFVVFGDWGQVDANGQNGFQAGLMQQIAGSGARFAITVGDNGYPNGNQVNYGDLQQTGADTSAIFGSDFWTVSGSSIPIFTAVGNHGVSGVKHTDITTWTQSTAVATSGGRYQNDVYCCINGTFAGNYGSEWYAFSAGNVRFYMLDSAWGDTNAGTATPYANDALAHFAPGSPEYTWLLNDLTTHPTQLKFAFSHYPFYSDSPNESSDTYLQGAANLEGLLGGHGVQLAFNGHAHFYQRNRASAAGMPITYVTGGGGATLEPIGPCSTVDAYGIGWSNSHQTGSQCGTGVAPTSAAEVHHYIKVTVNGTSVTVTPTDSSGRTFDVQTYTFKVPTDTYIDSGPPPGTRVTSATFTFHGSGTPATYRCQLDTGSQTSCLSPITYSNLAQGNHTFKVTATYNKSVDPTPAQASWTVDTTSPGAPGTLSASSPDPFDVTLTWGAASDNLGVTGYDIFRDGSLYQSVGAVTSFADSVLGSSTHQYAVRARDVAGNVSALGNQVSVATAPPPPPVFADGFESGDTSAWNASAGLVVETTNVNAGVKAAEGDTTNGNTFAKKVLPSTYTDGYARLWFDLPSQVSQVNVLRLRDAAASSIGYVYVDSTGLLGYHNDATGLNDLSGLSVAPGWHVIELHVKVDASAGVVEVWLDNRYVGDLGGTALNTGSAPIASMQIGEVQAGRTYDVIFDDAAFGTSRLGPEADTVPPSVPSGLTGTAVSPFEADLSWSASTDNVSVSGYDLYRDGIAIASLGPVLAYNDTGTSPGSAHSYTLRSRDASGNVSALSAPFQVTQPRAQPPLFADGFETGDVSSWTSSTGLVVQGADTRSGGFAAEGNPAPGTAFAKKTLPSTYSDAYARVAFEVKSQTSQVTLLRLRDTPAGNGGYVYLTAGGKLGFRSDALAAGTTSAVAPGPGWHAVELHLQVNGSGSAVEVWLDGAAVPDLTFSAIDLGTAPVGVLQIGDTASGTWDVLFDDAAFGTSRLGAVGDTAAPSTPANVAATAGSAFSVQVTWDASTDDVGVTGYDLFRNGALLAQTQTPGYTDNQALAGTTYAYTVRARDVSGNVSPLSAAGSATTPAALLPLFADGFESADLTAWTAANGLTVEPADFQTGQHGAEGNTTAGSTYARRALGATYADAYSRVAFLVKSQASQVTLLRLRDTPTGNGGYVYLTAGGKLGFHNDTTAVNNTSSVAPGAGWHVVELHLQLNGGAGLVEVWLDGSPVPDLTASGVDLGSSAIGVLQIGDTAPGGTWDVVFDNAAFGVGRLGPEPDAAPPSIPANLVANADTAFSVQVGWDPSTDDQAVGGYDLWRDGALLVHLGAVTSYSDLSVLAGTTHTYAVRALDLSGNLSNLSAPVTVTLPAAGLPIFADGFEGADLSAWTTTLGMSAESSDQHTGGFAAEAAATGGLTYAKKTLPSTYADAYSRVAFKVNSQGSQVTLLRLRDTPTGNGGYVFLTAGGSLAFRSDARTSATISSVSPGAGWHVVELHLAVNGTSSVVEVWLDGAAVPDLTFGAIDLGTAPIGVMQIGDTATSGTWDVLFDDVAFGTGRLGTGGDTTPPSAPADLIAGAPTPFEVDLSWSPSTDNVGVTGYDVLRDGAVIAQVTGTGFTDGGVFPTESHEYTVRARDVSGNVSALSTSAYVTTPAAPAPVFGDGFESGDGTSWTTFTGLSVGSGNVNSGVFSAEGHPSAGAGFAKKTLSGTYSDAYARVAFDVLAQGSAVTILRLRDTPAGNGGYLLLTSTGKLAFHNDATGITTSSVAAPGAGWHVIELHLVMNGSSSAVETWLDGAPVPDLSWAGTTLGVAPIGVLQIGDTANGTWDILFDDAAFSASRIGPGGDTVAPAEPGNLAAAASSAFSVQVTWDASTDDVGVTGYDLFRDGRLIARLSTPGYTDSTVLASTAYQYSVRARDAYGNVSTTALASVTTPAAAAPVFADGFEGANAWTTVTGLATQATEVHAGSLAAEGSTTTGATFAKKTLAATYSDAYARVYFKVKSQTSQVTLLRLRNTPTGTGGFVFLTSGGKLAFRSDALASATTSVVAPGPGWHSLELHLQINGASSGVELWLDGVAVQDLTFGVIDLGAAPVGVIQIGETAGGTWDVVFDDAAFGTSRIGVQ